MGSDLRLAVLESPPDLIDASGSFRHQRQCRHHDIAELRALLSDFDLVDERRIGVATVNGHLSQAVQLLAR
ncbi:hypothetical protein [Streptomyces sp. NPDC101165]|uniref:hypothetical protein n=1 Tax=Streptomyces sp. NPDC101165 TaxID=3366119 RepID=UPI003805D948